MSQRTAESIGRNNPSGLTITEFMDAYHHIVRAVIVRYVPRALGDSEDLAQEIWTQFIQGKEGVSYLEI